MFSWIATRGSGHGKIGEMHEKIYINSSDAPIDRLMEMIMKMVRCADAGAPLSPDSTVFYIVYICLDILQSCLLILLYF